MCASSSRTWRTCSGWPASRAGPAGYEAVEWLAGAGWPAVAVTALAAVMLVVAGALATELGPWDCALKQPSLRCLVWPGVDKDLHPSPNGPACSPGLARARARRATGVSAPSCSATCPTSCGACGSSGFAARIGRWPWSGAVAADPAVDGRVCATRPTGTLAAVAVPGLGRFCRRAQLGGGAVERNLLKIYYAQRAAGAGIMVS